MVTAIKASAGTGFLPGGSYLMEAAPVPLGWLRKPPGPGKVALEDRSCFILVLCFCLFKLPRSWKERRPAGPQSFGAALRSPGHRQDPGANWAHGAIGVGDAMGNRGVNQTP